MWEGVESESRKIHLGGSVNRCVHLELQTFELEKFHHTSQTSKIERKDYVSKDESTKGCKKSSARSRGN